MTGPAHSATGRRLPSSAMLFNKVVHQRRPSTCRRGAGAGRAGRCGGASCGFVAADRESAETRSAADHLPASTTDGAVNHRGVPDDALNAATWKTSPAIPQVRLRIYMTSSRSARLSRSRRSAAREKRSPAVARRAWLSPHVSPRRRHWSGPQWNLFAMQVNTATPGHAACCRRPTVGRPRHHNHLLMSRIASSRYLFGQIP